MLNPVLCPELAARIRSEFKGRGPGHCLRIDHLSRVDALALATELESETKDFRCVVLSLSPEHGAEIRPDQAVELRNRKDTGICLVVPDELGQDAASSLSNSFALLDLQGFLVEFRNRCFRNLPDSIQPHVRAVFSHLRGRAAVSVEDLIAFYLEIAKQPEPAWVGRCLWMVGLVPDFGDDFAVRLARNRKAVDAISRPTRPQSSAEERLKTLRLTSPDYERSLTRHLASRTLHQPEHWQRPVAQELEGDRLSFDKWPFPDTSGADLSEISVDPFVDKHGSVQAYCKLKQDQPGMALTGEVGSKHKVVVRWKSEPAVPLGAAKWRADLIPSRSEYGEDVAVVLVSSSIKLGRKQASLTLDIDLDETEYRATQVRICALDAIGAEIVDAEGSPVLGYSEDFWLGQPEDLDEPDRPRKRTDISLPLARVRVAMDAASGTTAIEESSAQLSDNSKEEARYFALQLGTKTIVRLAISRVLATIHDRCLENPRLAWFTAIAESDQQLRADGVQPDPLPGEYIRGAWEDFFRQRDSLMKELRRRGVRSRIEALEIDSSIRDRARKYAKSYRDLMEDIQERKAVDELRWALRTDTLQVEIQYAGDQRQRATVVLPTHPLRLLWYVSYADLLEHYIGELLKTPKRERSARIELAALEKLGPVNLPMFVPDDGSLHCFAHNLGLFAGVLLPPGVREPARTLSDPATVLGMVRDFGPGHDFPIDKLARELQEYCSLHAYSGALRVSVSNPGDGAVISVALQRLYEGFGATTDGSVPPHLDVLAHCSNPLPIDLPILDRLRERLYVSSTRTGSHLNPVVQIAIRELSQMDSPTGGDVNLAILFDHQAPEIVMASPIRGQDSASAYGLLHRIATEFSSNGDHARWSHQIAYDPDTAHERHPVASAYTTELIDTHVRMLKGATALESRTIPADAAERVSLALTLDDKTRAGLDSIHHKADWVILMDRYLGIDLFDDPADPFVAAVSRKYLLDYAPEFIDGLGHRLVVTTMWREEVEDILARAMDELGFSAIEESVGEALQQLKSVSGRLALRLIRDNSRAREAASLGVVVAWLRATGELSNSILVPVDAHPEIFAAGESRSSRNGEVGVLNRCDLIQIRFGSRRK